ncbi:dimethylarginine dimethylaminohydrolase family protein [Maridesulfovibrio ferrireducens]|uniref:dimethylarginine dimethylaminohydrolase family protein n=1 Tax=Maridesulfovibrio ferrireducens TaxID=246191 RepID=UPI0026EFABC0|nr:arginine deiminase-related protein [Maridesulfovibrio ferrireducens]
MKNIFSKAIVRTPAHNLGHGLTEAGLGCPDMELTHVQHRNYIKYFESKGIAVTVLDAVEDFPDSVFVEDTAVMIPIDGGVAAFLTCPGAKSRRGEVERIKPVLASTADEIFQMEGDGLMEGGDILLMGNIFFVGIDSRTNYAGFEQFEKVARKFGYKCVPVPFDNGMPHLKTELSTLDDETLIMSNRFSMRDEFSGYRRMVVPTGEEYAANCLYMGNCLLAPAGFPASAEMLDKNGFSPDYIDMSEFRKMDGGLTCLSLRW